MESNVVIVGGGAAGLLAAASSSARLREAGSPARVILLEAAREPGRKILVSGGGHCNVLPAREARARFVSSSPRRLVDRFLDRSPLAAQRAFFPSSMGLSVLVPARVTTLTARETDGGELVMAIRFKVSQLQ